MESDRMMGVASRTHVLERKHGDNAGVSSKEVKTSGLMLNTFVQDNDLETSLLGPKDKKDHC